MPKSLRTCTLLALVAICLSALSATASAKSKTKVAVGLGDQSPVMFDAPAYQALKLKKTRYFVRWDAARHPDALAAADTFVDGARRNHVRVLMQISTNDFTTRKAKLPSVKQYKRDVGKLVRHFKRKGVKEWGTWNEANHVSQPTYRSPTRAAQFFKTMRSLCKGCKIIALDVLDQKGSKSYIQRFYKALSSTYRKRATIVGIHNYSDTNRRRSSGTKTIISAVKHYNRRTDFWLTETGGVVAFGRSFPCNEKRAASRLSYMFHLAKKYRHDVTRLYAYNWQGTDCESRFDAGLVNADGSIRPGYTSFKKGLASFTR